MNSDLIILIVQIIAALGVVISVIYLKAKYINKMKLQKHSLDTRTSKTI